jgi:hypothetical protein
MVNLAPSLSQVLVVPPFECAWLAGENFLLRDGTGCVSFEVKGESLLFGMNGPLTAIGTPPGCLHMHRRVSIYS